MPKHAGHQVAPVLGVLQLALAAWAATSGQTIRSGPVSLDTENAGWLLLWSLASLGRNGPTSRCTEILGLCALLFQPAPARMMCLGLAVASRQMEIRVRIPVWRIALLAPALCAMAVLAPFPSTNSLAPLAGLLLLPALADMPVLGFAMLGMLSPSLTAGAWPGVIVVLGLVGTFAPWNGRRAIGWPLTIFGILLANRAMGLPDSALAAAEALVLTLAVDATAYDRPDGWSIIFQAPIPPLAGFLSVWLAMHAAFALAAAAPGWTAGCLALAPCIGLIVAHALRGTLSTLSAIWPLRHTPDPVNTVKTILLALCPGLLFGLLHPTLLSLAGANVSLWRGWPLWSVAGGDGGMWYPAAATIITGAALAIIIALTPRVVSGPLHTWPKPRPAHWTLPVSWRRILVVMRRIARLTRRRAGYLMTWLKNAAGRDLATRHALVVWLLLTGMGLAILDWTQGA